MTRFVGISDETQINSKDVITIKLPATGTFYQGDQLIAEKLITGSRTNYEGEEVEASTVDAETVIIINQNVYKEGNRYFGFDCGNYDYTGCNGFPCTDSVDRITGTTYF